MFNRGQNERDTALLNMDGETQKHESSDGSNSSVELTNQEKTDGIKWARRNSHCYECNLGIVEKEKIGPPIGKHTVYLHAACFYKIKDALEQDEFGPLDGPSDPLKIAKPLTPAATLLETLKPKLPIVLALRVESSNDTTCMIGLKKVVDELKSFKMPKVGDKIEDAYWKVTVIESRNLLQEHVDAQNTAALGKSNVQ